MICLCISSSTDKYEDARQGSIRALEESDLNTGPETNFNVLQERKRRINNVAKIVPPKSNENSDADESSSEEERPLIPTPQLRLVDHGKNGGEKYSENHNLF